MATNAPGKTKLPASSNHYLETGFRTMASLPHDRARQTILNLLIGLLAPESLVAGELPILFDPANHRRHLGPDIMVSLGVGEEDPIFEGLRAQYRLWDEGKPPELVIELASPSTKERDSAGKKEDYAAMGVREYVQFDPKGDLLAPRLQVYRLEPGGYVRLPEAAMEMVDSLVLEGYAWAREGNLLRLWDRAAQRLAPTPEEQAAAEAKRANAETARADAETARAASEAARANAAEARIRALEALLGRQQPDVSPDEG